MKKLFLLLVAVLSIGLCASAQTRTVKGTVLDAENDEPLIGVSVTAGTDAMGVTTDIDGDFTIVVPESAKHLTISYIGYQTQTVKISDAKLVIKLQSSTMGLDEVIAVAYGTVKKAEYTGSASVVKADQLQDVLVSNVTNALSGKMSGVITQSSNGQPGSSSSVLIRGIGSINTSSSPLYVVDGMPYNGDIAAIPTTDIEAITVLKDAASTALYGERGANGVIQITTKRGREGSARVTIDMRWGQNSRMLPNYDVISDTRQYLETYYQAIYNTQYYYNGRTKEAAAAYAANAVFPNLGYTTFTVPEGQNYFGADGKFNPNATEGYSNGRYFFKVDDWEKYALTKGLRQEYNMSVTGGTERISYYLSGTYLGDEGIIYASDFKRFSTRAAVDFKVNDWLKLNSSIMYTYYDTGSPDNQTNGGASTVNTFYFVNGIAPVYPMFVRGVDGQVLRDAALGNKPVYDYGDGHDYGNGLMGAMRSQSGNPTGNLIYDINRYYCDIFDGKWSARLTPLAGLTITGTAGLFIDNTRYSSLSNPFYGQNSTAGGGVYQATDRLRTLTFQGIAEYTKTFNDVHNVTIMAGYENEDFHSEGIQATGYNLYQPFVPVVNNTSDDRRGYGTAANLVHRAIIGRVRYNFNDRYFVSGSVRRGASSRFAEDKRWGTFFSASAGWDIAKEHFMEDFTNVDQLKFKASFGQNGNDLIGSNYIAYADQYQISGSDGVWSDGVLSYKGNPDVTWEKSNAFNIGFDFSFFKGMLSGTAEYYNRQTSDMLFSIPVSPSLGYSSMPKNVGSMRNNGFEIELNYRPVNTKDVTVDIFANATFQGNKILKLAPEIMTYNEQFDCDFWRYSNTHWFKEGESMYQYYLVEDAGIVHNQAELDEVVAAGGVGELGGRLFWAKNPETGEMYRTGEYQTALDTHRKCTGNLLPKVYGGFGFNVDAYGFDLSATFSYQLGGRLIDYGYQNVMQPGTNVGMNMHKDLLNAWTEDNQNTNIPKLYTNTGYQYATAVTEKTFLTSSNYLSLNNVTFGYTLPQSLTSKLQLGSVRVYFSGENLALWSRRKGLDPRQGFGSSENYTYSPIRTLSGGINISF